MIEDTNALNVPKDGMTYYRISVDGTGLSEAVKISNKNNVKLTECRLLGGNEDCLDIVRGSNHEFHGCCFIPSRKTRTMVTIKGGAKGIVLQNCMFRTSEKTKYPWDISIGDYTIYDKYKTTPKTEVKIREAVTGGRRTANTNGPKPIVLVLNGEVDADHSVRVWKVPTIFVRILFQFQRWFGDKREPVL